MSRNIVITSGKGGVGKTTLCANLGFALASANQRVLLVDFDIGLNNLDVVMGVENKIVYDIIDVLEGKCRPKQALIQDFFMPNLYVFPSNHIFCKKKIEISDIELVIKELETGFDFILFDSPAGIDNGFFRSISMATESIVVTTPHISAIRDADKVVSLLKGNNINNVSLIVNRARGDLMIDGDMLNIETIEDFLKIELIGVVPEDDNTTRQLLCGGAITKESDAKISFDLIVDYLINGKKEIFDCTKKYRGVLGSIRKGLRKIV